MKIKINDNSRQFNCHWYCDKTGETYKVKRIDEQAKCYVVMINRIEHFVSQEHADKI